MRAILVTAASSFIGLTISNFGWQLLATNPQWNVAAERSFFQLGAIALVIGLITPTIRQLEKR